MKKLCFDVLTGIFEGIMKIAGVGFAACLFALYGWMAYHFAYPMITIIWFPEEVPHNDFFKYLIAMPGALIAVAMLIVPILILLRNQQQKVK